MIKKWWKRRKYWQKYGIIGSLIHVLITLAIIESSKNCAELCINPLNLLLAHVIIPALLITETLIISTSDNIFNITILILSAIAGFIIGAVVGMIKDKNILKK